MVGFHPHLAHLSLVAGVIRSFMGDVVRQDVSRIRHPPRGHNLISAAVSLTLVPMAAPSAAPAEEERENAFQRWNREWFEADPRLWPIG